MMCSSAGSRCARNAAAEEGPCSFLRDDVPGGFFSPRSRDSLANSVLSIADDIDGDPLGEAGGVGRGEIDIAPDRNPDPPPPPCCLLPLFEAERCVGG